MKLVMLMLIMLLVCACTPTYQIVEKTHYLYLPIGTALTNQVVPERPPEREVFVLATPDERVNLLTNYSRSLLGTTINLNNRLVNIAEVDEKHKALVEKTNAEEDARVSAIISGRINDLKAKK